MKAERLKEKLGKQDFHYDMEEVFEPVTAKQVEATENHTKQIQELRDSTQTTTGAIGQQTQGFVQAIQVKLEQYENRVTLWINKYKNLIKNMMKLLTVIFNLLLILLIPTKLILVP